ncbi:M48 family metallopeptidase [Parahaliea mediterranea]|uniref:M48 family metallopeptidase n=1 Tax=Parahaliea mediterranea TaxID=651086 RepID=A0A939DI17_9GAMM|nr:M48 family metallopeptidase [Parahaliea mediterranea]MBN7798710.1 M48 family metallopeptidase [Parahaliea mediterranea]
MTADCRLGGSWQDGATSHSRDAVLEVSGERVSVRVDGAIALEASLSQLSISPRLGSTPRYIRFEGHPGRLETADPAAADWLDARVGTPSSHALWRLENHSLLAAIAGVLMLALAAAYFVWGIPAVSRAAAAHLPAGVMDRASRETLELLQSRYLGPSSLDAGRQQRIRHALQSREPGYPVEQLRFAHSDPLGANALALPDGTIILTDALVELAANDTEVLAVIAHELGHIEHRHAVRQLLQGAAIGVTVALVGGDVSTLGDIVLTLPVVFTQLHYSRDFELEADRYARDFLRRQQLDPEALDRMLVRLHGQAPDEGLPYFGTHPHLEQRLARDAPAAALDR